MLQLMNLRGINNAALHKVVNTLSDEKISNWKMQDLQQERFAEVKETIMLPKVDGGEMQWDVANPSALVSMSCRLSTEMQRAFA